MAAALDQPTTVAAIPRLSTPTIDVFTVSSNALQVINTAGTRDAPTMRVALQRALAQLQPSKFPFDETRLRCEFGFAEAAHTMTLERLRNAGSLPDDFRCSAAEQQVIEAHCDDAIALLADLQPSVAAGLNLLVGSLLVCRGSAGGGGVSNVVGAIWISPGSCWSVVDYADMILHEYVHQALFLDDMVRRIFAAPLRVLQGERALVRSAVLQRPRDYDKAYHSAFVGHALAELRAALGQHDDALARLVPVLATLDGLHQRTSLLTEHGRRRLVALTERVIDLHERLSGAR